MGLHKRGSVGVRRAAAVLAVISLVLGGCYSGDFSFHVQNETDQTWWLRVAIGGQWEEDDVWVAQVKPGADGRAFDWFGTETEPVELLDGECNVIGVFSPDGQGVYRVAEVPGITGTVTAIGREFPGPRPSDDGLIIGDGICGGMRLM